MSEYDVKVIRDFLSWLYDRYDVFVPETDGYTLYSEMKYCDSDDVLSEYLADVNE